MFTVLNSAKISLHIFFEMLNVRPEIVVSSVCAKLRRSLVTRTETLSFFDNLNAVAGLD